MNINLELTIQYNSPDISGVPKIIIRNVIDAIALIKDNKAELEALRMLLHDGLAKVENYQAKLAMPQLRKSLQKFDIY